jgi:hypothetical protein
MSKRNNNIQPMKRNTNRAGNYGVISRLRGSRTFKAFMGVSGLAMFFQMALPATSMALTGGPSQPEVQSFSPIGTSEMVNISSGDFNYNIPLLDVGGYPINLLYNAGITQDQEASMVGLGWNINPGAITRQLRGLPDDFDGDLVEKEFYMRPNRTYGVNFSAGGLELFGFDPDVGGLLAQLAENSSTASVSLGVTYNNYTGLGISQGMQFSANTCHLNGGLGITAGLDGLNISPSLGFHKRGVMVKNKMHDITSSVGVSINSRQGLTSINMKGSSNNVEVAKGQKSLTATLSLANNTYVPQLDFPRSNLSFSGTLQTGISVFAADAELQITGSYQEQKLTTTSQTIGAFGYMHADGANRGVVMLDFNRENDGGFTNKVTKHLPLTNHTYDVFSIAGQGIGGMFRPFRSEIGHVHDSYVASSSFSASIPFDVEAGGVADIGFDFSVNTSISTSGDWTQDNPAGAQLRYADPDPTLTYEPTYFRQVGEMGVDEDGLFEATGGYAAVAIPIVGAGGWQVETEESFVTSNGTNLSAGLTNMDRDSRVKRNQLISTLTHEEAVVFSMDPDRHVNANAAPNHIAEMKVLRPDGASYVYGQPAYNNVQKEVSFNISRDGATGDCSSGLVNYIPGVDDAEDNGNGRNHFYSSTSLPPYAHSYLLTEVLSADYVDVDGNGPSVNDYGSYTRFEYASVDDYKWRVPYGEDPFTANFNEGLFSDNADDMASYVYGEKDLQYVTKIETKTHVAIFEMGDRADAMEVVGSMGTRGSRSMQKLKTISLYSKVDYDESANPVPIKVVHFEYDYTLCPGVANNSGNPADPDGVTNTMAGKLTLKKVWFTYQNSNRGIFSPYEFTYSTENPAYNLKAYDIWGKYKDQTGINCDPSTGEPSNPEFPYVDQTGSNNNYEAYNLIGIKLPSGGSIAVEYESDDYAYVQDRRAMQMFKVLSCGQSTAFVDPLTDPDAAKLYTLGANGERTFLYFDVDPAIATNDAAVKAHYVQDIVARDHGLMYFRFQVRLDALGEYDYVPGYAKVKSCGVTSTDADKGYIELEKVDRGDTGISPDVHPISKAAWNFTRVHNPILAFGLPNNFPDTDQQGNGVISVFKAMAQASIVKQLVEFFIGANLAMHIKQYGKVFVPTKSWIRLMNPNKKKLGGGHRVKKIKINDNWNEMTTDGFGYEYGQEYEYLTAAGTSSGVATFESAQSKENPHVQPIFMTEKHLLVADNEHFIETPIGQSFFPAPTVTYGRVMVKSLSAPKLVDENGDPHATLSNARGKTVHEFYTSRDYPTRVDNVQLDVIRKSLMSDFSIVSNFTKDFLTATEGFLVHTNDMNGKPKAQWVYGEGQAEPLSGAEYLYGTGAGYADTNGDDPFENLGSVPASSTLDNACVVIDDQGQVHRRTVGVDFDVVTDFREQETEAIGMGANAGLSTFLVGIIPGVVPTIWPDASYNKTRFRSAVVTKVVNQYGILREVVVHDLGSRVSTKNVAWDAETGEVLLTETLNEYGDKYYSLGIPAHWSYKRMGQASTNIGLVTEVTTDGYGLLSLGHNLTHGDEVYIGIPADNKKAWVSVDYQGDYYLIKNNEFVLGNLTGATATVIRSGYRNQQALAVGSITMKTNPIDPNNDGIMDDIDQYTFLTDLPTAYDAGIISATAVEYDDHWKTFPGVDPCPDGLPVYLNDHEKSVGFVQGLINSNQLSYVAAVDMSLLPPVTTYYSNDPNHCVVATCNDVEVSNSATIMSTHSEFIATCANGGCPEQLDLLHITLNGAPAGLDFTNIISVSYDPAANVVPHPLHAPPFEAFYLTGEWAGGVTHLIDVTKFQGVAVIDCEGQEACGLLNGDLVNPFVAGIRGTFRAKRSHLYQEERQQASTAVYATTDPNAEMDMRNDGSYAAFTPFWTFPVSGDPWGKDNTNWTWASEVTNYSPFGPELENRDALYRHSAAVFGYANTMAIAVASNTRYNQLAFDGFEDYDFYDIQDCAPRHFAFEEHRVAVTEGVAHTGHHSLKILAGATVSTIRELHSSLYTQSCLDGDGDNVPYSLKDCDFVGLWGPQTVFPATEDQSAREYVLSYWVKDKVSSLTPTYDYTAITPSVTVNGTNLLASAVPVKGKLIEGWQRVEYRFTIASATQGSIMVGFTNGDLDNNSFIDDVRIHPVNSGVKTYVYNAITYRLMAELDNNNYATFYEYNEEGALIRVKKETERGVMTLQESGGHTALD